MAISPERKPRLNPDLDPALRDPALRTDDPMATDVYVRETATTKKSGSTAGFLIAALLVLLGFIFALYFGSRSDTTTPPVTQNNETIVPEATPPAATSESATPPAATTEPTTPPAASTEPATPPAASADPAAPAQPTTEPSTTSP